MLHSRGRQVNMELLCEKLWLPWDQPPAEVPDPRRLLDLVTEGSRF